MAHPDDSEMDETFKMAAPMTPQRSDAEIQETLRAEIAQLRMENTQIRQQMVKDALAHQAHIVWHQGHGENLPPLPEMIERLEKSPHFDAGWYAARDPGVQEAGLSPAEHYTRAGAYEGRDPGPDFDTMGYYLANPDVARSRWPALLHYEMFGRTEGRRLHPED